MQFLKVGNRHKHTSSNKTNTWKNSHKNAYIISQQGNANNMRITYRYTAIKIPKIKKPNHSKNQERFGRCKAHTLLVEM